MKQDIVVKFTSLKNDSKENILLTSVFELLIEDWLFTLDYSRDSIVLSFELREFLGINSHIAG